MSNKIIYTVSTRNWNASEEAAEHMQKLESFGVEVFKNLTDLDYKYRLKTESQEKAVMIHEHFKCLEDLMGGIIRFETETVKEAA